MNDVQSNINTLHTTPFVTRYVFWFHDKRTRYDTIHTQTLTHFQATNCFFLFTITASNQTFYKYFTIFYFSCHALPLILNAKQEISTEK